MKCPICSRPVKRDEEDFPFCSARCREVDLGNWAMEKYVITTPLPSQSNPSDDEE